MALKRRFGVHVATAKRQWRYFKTLSDAKVFCGQVFDLLGVVLTIVEFNQNRQIVGYKVIKTGGKSNGR